MAEEKSTQKLLIVIISLLTLLLIVQTAVIVTHLIKGESGKKVEVQSDKIHPADPSRNESPLMAAKRASQAYRSPFADPFDLLSQWENRMDRMMSTMFQAAPLVHSSMSGAFDFVPTIDLQEKDDHYFVRVDLPGLEKDKIDLSVQGNMLTISGERQNVSKNEAEDYYAQERSYGYFSRSVQLPGPVNDSNIAADYKDGVLTVKLSKAEPKSETRKIPIA